MSQPTLGADSGECGPGGRWTPVLPQALPGYMVFPVDTVQASAGVQPERPLGARSGSRYGLAKRHSLGPLIACLPCRPSAIPLLTKDGKQGAGRGLTASSPEWGGAATEAVDLIWGKLWNTLTRRALGQRQRQPRGWQAPLRLPWGVRMQLRPQKLTHLSQPAGVRSAGQALLILPTS